LRPLAVIPSKQRPELFQKVCRPFVDNLGIDTIVVLEPEDYDQYDYPNKLKLERSNAGIWYALTEAKRYAEENGYDVIFKIDDDVSAVGEIANDLTEILSYFNAYPNLGAVVFPYDFEFYAKSKRLFTHVNKRVQTCYLIRTSSFRPREEINTFEDFYQFFQMVYHNEFTLFCARHPIKCKPVGSGAGGHQAFDRKEQAAKEIAVFQSMDPTVGIIVKEDKRWYYEPKLNGTQYKSRKLK
jgi:hypothetical protein